MSKHVFKAMNLPKTRESGNFIVPTNDFLFKAMLECTYSEFKILIVLMTHANRKTSACFPSEELIAQETGISRSHVNTCTKSLEEKGFIIKGKHHGRVNQYYILDENYHLNIMDSYDVYFEDMSEEQKESTSSEYLSVLKDSEQDSESEEDYAFTFDVEPDDKQNDSEKDFAFDAKSTDKQDDSDEEITFTFDVETEDKQIPTSEPISLEEFRHQKVENRVSDRNEYIKEFRRKHPGENYWVTLEDILGKHKKTSNQ